MIEETDGQLYRSEAEGELYWGFSGTLRLRHSSWDITTVDDMLSKYAGRRVRITIVDTEVERENAQPMVQDSGDKVLESQSGDEVHPVQSTWWSVRRPWSSLHQSLKRIREMVGRR